MNAEFLDDLKSRIIDMVEAMKEQIRGRYEDPPGLREMDDFEHRVWFEGMAAADPDWPRMLPYVEGGMDEVNRYLRTVQPEEEVMYAEA